MLPVGIRVSLTFVASFRYIAIVVVGTGIDVSQLSRLVSCRIIAKHEPIPNCMNIRTPCSSIAWLASQTLARNSSISPMITNTFFRWVPHRVWGSRTAENYTTRFIHLSGANWLFFRKWVCTYIKLSHLRTWLPCRLLSNYALLQCGNIFSNAIDFFKSQTNFGWCKMDEWTDSALPRHVHTHSFSPLVLCTAAQELMDFRTVFRWSIMHNTGEWIGMLAE